MFRTGGALSLLLDELRNGSMGEVFEIEGSSIEIGSGIIDCLAGAKSAREDFLIELDIP